MGLKYVILGYSLALLTMLACGSVSYKYYGLSVPTSCYDQGKLLGPKPEDDIPFSTCKPEAHKQGKCIVMESAEFFAAKKELQQLRQALKDCQKGASP